MPYFPIHQQQRPGQGWYSLQCSVASRVRQTGTVYLWCSVLSLVNWLLVDIKDDIIPDSVAAVLEDIIDGVSATSVRADAGQQLSSCCCCTAASNSGSAVFQEHQQLLHCGLDAGVDQGKAELLVPLFLIVTSGPFKHSRIVDLCLCTAVPSTLTVLSRVLRAT